MENTRTYSVKGILTALGKSLLYLLFFLAVQLLAGILYAAVASLSPGGADTENILAGTETAVLLSYLLTAAAVLLWFRLRHRPLGEAAGLRRCSGWTAAFCAFCAVGLFVVVQLALTLLPATWMTGYNDHMERLLSNGLIPALSIAVAAPLTEELMFRGVIQPRLEPGHARVGGGGGAGRSVRRDPRDAHPDGLCVPAGPGVWLPPQPYRQHPSRLCRPRRVQRDERPAGAFRRCCGERVCAGCHGSGVHRGLRAVPPWAGIAGGFS